MILRILWLLPVATSLLTCDTIQGDFCTQGCKDHPGSQPCLQHYDAFQAFACCNASASEAALPLVELPYGNIRGIVDETPYKYKLPFAYPYSQAYPLRPSYRFLGIPYAQADRFAPPEDPERWSGVFDANAPGVRCYQVKSDPLDVSDTLASLFYAGASPLMGEDCLTLNVFTTNFTAPKPVLVFIHGGSFMTGSKDITTDWPWELDDFVFVSINYRLGAFGYLALEDFMTEYDTSGNFGTLDQIMALKWIQNNIAQFGGDPDQVVISGQSAGGASVEVLLASPSARGLFVGAMSMSGVFPSESLAERAGLPRISSVVNQAYPLTTSAGTRFQVYREHIQNLLGIDSDADLVGSLRALDPETLVEFMVNVSSVIATGPTIDDRVLPANWIQNPNPFNIPVFVTNTLREAAYWSPSSGGSAPSVNFTENWQYTLAANTDAVATQINTMYGSPDTDEAAFQAGVDVVSDGWIARQYLYAKQLAKNATSYYAVLGVPGNIFGNDLYGAHGQDLVGVFGNALLYTLTGANDVTFAVAQALRQAMRTFIHTRRIDDSLPVDPSNLTAQDVLMYRQRALNGPEEVDQVSLGYLKGGRIEELIELRTPPPSPPPSPCGADNSTFIHNEGSHNERSCAELQESYGSNHASIICRNLDVMANCREYCCHV